MSNRAFTILFVILTGLFISTYVAEWVDALAMHGRLR